MINRLIEFSLKNRFLVLLAYALLAAWGYWALASNSHRRDTGPQRKPGHRLYRLAGQQPAGSRRSDHVSADREPARIARSEDGALVFRVRFFDDQHHFRRRRRRVLRTNARPRAFESRVELFFLRVLSQRLGPDATGVGQVFWYTVEGPYDPGTLRSLQDWFIRYQLNSVPGVAEVASIGGFVRQYQIDVDPAKLRAYNIPMRTVFEAVERSNNNVGAKVVEANDMEYVVRGLGLIESVKDIEDIVLSSDEWNARVRSQCRRRPGWTGVPPRRSGQGRNRCRWRRRRDSLWRECARR